jgi:hypothetical protein
LKTRVLNKGVQHPFRTPAPFPKQTTSPEQSGFLADIDTFSIEFLDLQLADIDTLQGPSLLPYKPTEY